jgi:Ser/Thr protein kinase RdoA (MazF antagonist)
MIKTSKYSDVRKIISKVWPQAKIESIKEFPEGYNNVAYDVKLETENYVIKIMKIKGFERYAIKQKKLRTLIRKKFKDFPIAKVVKLDYSKKVIDKPYIITEKIEGESLLKAYDNVKNKEELFEQIGEIYGKMHSIKLDKYGELDENLNLIKVHRSIYVKNCEKMSRTLKKIEDRKLLSKKSVESHKKFFENHKELLKKENGPVLCHGDSALTNIIVKKEGGKYKVSGIIDFEFCRSSGVVHDLFGGFQRFHKKYAYKDSLVKGHSKYCDVPKEWEDLTLLYKWIGHLEKITQIRKMKWRNLNEEKTVERKKELRKHCLQELRKIMKVLGKNFSMNFTDGQKKTM